VRLKRKRIAIASMNQRKLPRKRERVRKLPKKEKRQF